MYFGEYMSFLDFLIPSIILFGCHGYLILFFEQSAGIEIFYLFFYVFADLNDEMFVLFLYIFEKTF